MILRFLFWIALAVLIVAAVKSKLRELSGGVPSGRLKEGAAPASGARRPRAPEPAAVERMACCARCGLHFPSSEAVAAGGREYCCAAHAHGA